MVDWLCLCAMLELEVLMVDDEMDGLLDKEKILQWGKYSVCASRSVPYILSG